MLTLNRVILQFNTFEARDEWIERFGDHVVRLFRRDPWVAVQLSDTELTELRHQSNVRVHPDPTLHSAK